MNIREYYLSLTTDKKVLFIILSSVILISLIVLFSRLHNPGPERGIKSSLKNLESEIPEKRINAVLRLAKTENKKVIPVLINTLKNDSNLRVRKATAWAIASLDRESFISLFHNPEKEIRKIVLETAGRREDSHSFLSYFLQALEDRELEVRKVAVSFLKKIKDPSSIEPLLNLAKNKDEDLELRKESLKILGDVGDLSIEKDLEELIYYDIEVRKEAKESLEKIKK